jgi:hypothetical protein
MAKVFAPFLSISARGTVAKTLTASAWMGRDYMKMRFIPNNPNSTRQQARRATMTDGVSKWRFAVSLISAANKVLWASYGAKHNVSGFNRFMKFYLEQNYNKTTGAKVTPQVIPSPI